MGTQGSTSWIPSSTLTMTLHLAPARCPGMSTLTNGGHTRCSIYPQIAYAKTSCLKARSQILSISNKHLQPTQHMILYASDTRHSVFPLLISPGAMVSIKLTVMIEV